MNERKKAKKEKKEEIAKLHIELMEACNKMIDYAIERKNKNNGNLFEIIAKTTSFALQVKTISNQIKIIREKPLPLKKSSVTYEGSVLRPNQECIISNHGTVTKLNTALVPISIKTFAIAGEKLSKGDAVFIDKNIIRKIKPEDLNDA